jgi:hypothetical protein
MNLTFYRYLRVSTLLKSPTHMEFIQQQQRMTSCIDAKSVEEHLMIFSLRCVRIEIVQYPVKRSK